MMMGKLYAALRAANVPDKEAGDAAEEVAAYDGRLGGFKMRLTRIEADLTILKWMVGTVVTLLVAIGGPALWLLLRVASKLGAL